MNDLKLGLPVHVHIIKYYHISVRKITRVTDNILSQDRKL